MELSIDTASERASIALSESGIVVSESTWRCRANHSVELVPSIDQLLERAGLERTQINTIFVCRGPGSYSGLRAGLSTAMALAFALQSEILGLGRLELDAYQHAAFPGPICAIHRAGRGELAWAVYQHRAGDWIELVAPRLSWPAALAEEAPAGALFCGELTPELEDLLRERWGEGVPLVGGSAAIRRAGTLAELGWQRYSAGERGSPFYVEPLYLREPQITLSRKNAG